jgi:hypothetical protein
VIDFGPVLLRNILRIPATPEREQHWLFVWQFTESGHYAVIKHVLQGEVASGTQQEDDGSWADQAGGKGL